MFESDADRLEMIRSLGGQLIECGSSTFWAIFDAEYVSVLGDPPIESAGPVLQCRTSDARSYGVRKDTRISIGAETYRVHRHEPDGTGMSLLFLFEQ